MEQWVIFSSPDIIIFMGIALFLNQFDYRYSSTHGFFTIISVIITLISLAFLCLNGAAYQEMIAELSFFLLFNLKDIFKKNKGDTNEF